MQSEYDKREENCNKKISTLRVSFSSHETPNFILCVCVCVCGHCLLVMFSGHFGFVHRTFQSVLLSEESSPQVSVCV